MRELQHHAHCKVTNKLPIFSVAIEDPENLQVAINHAEDVVLVHGIVLAFFAKKLNIVLVKESLLLLFEVLIQVGFV